MARFNTVITIRVDDQVLLQFRKQCESEGRSYTEVVRSLIEGYVEGTVQYPTRKASFI